MLELNVGGIPAGGSDLIKDTSEATFMVDVIEASHEVPVIVDFWAPWCGPCKTLGPALEQGVKDAKGAVKMVKVDVDQNQQIAGQLQIQSIPTVYAFYKGKPIDAFQGALPASEIKTFIDKLIAESGGEVDEGLGEAIAAAEAMLDEGAAVDAAQTFAAILGEEPNNPAAYGGLIRAHLALEELDKAAALLENAPAELNGLPEIEAARAQLELLQQAANTGPAAELQAKVDENPDDHQARLDLAVALHASGDAQGAVDHLLELFRRDREWNDGAAKAQLFTVFDALKPDDPIVLNGRRKLSSMIFV
ncbi:thioredoxin [Litoreibacter arenae]|uniref:Thioredoxin n=1 Tax=Litoreibacter arenae DSM 19593 TaxID=1123360 RepID=S9Q8U7_9RHOB|nr:thioredoxin [Litoreibacter arenae]EPX77811.1 Thioredoxin domain-containing protein EC-YbbN [Litoreibacter arenae DSM 19593]